jgi:cell division protein ZipA
MDGLRWLLLLCGVLVIAGVYLYSRRERAKSDSGAETNSNRVAAPRESPVEPFIGDAGVDEDGAAAVEAAPQSASSTRQKIVTLRVVARHKGAFRGDELILSLRGVGMRSGKFGIYHRYDGNDEDKTIFSAASLVEPGSFDLANIKEQAIPGISIFLVLPGPIDGTEAFDLMMQAARAIAKTMDGELLDESGCTLSIQRERYMREEIIQFQHQNFNLAG